MIIKRKNSGWALMALGIALAVVAFGSLTFGQIDVPLESCLAIVCHKFGLPFLVRMILHVNRWQLFGLSVCHVCLLAC